MAHSGNTFCNIPVEWCVSFVFFVAAADDDDDAVDDAAVIDVDDAVADADSKCKPSAAASMIASVSISRSCSR